MRVIIYDIETFTEIFLIVCYDPQEKQWYKFEVSRWKNEIDAFVYFAEEHEEYFWVGYNNLSFDAQIVEWVLRNYMHWIDKTGLEIAAMIAQKAQDRISDSNYNIFPEYKEENLSLKQIDLFTIWHFNNENRRTSLKAVEFAIDFENIEEMPFSHLKRDLTRQEIVDVITYCKNDVFATYHLYLITRGITDISIYKGKDKIADRLIMKEEFNLPCLNWDDVKIGAEWNKLDYINATRKKEKDLKPEKVNYFYGKRYRQFFPKTVKFKTKSLQQFVKTLGDTFVLNKFQEFKYKFNDELTATIAKGGIHSNETGRFLIPKENEIYWQCDIGSQYPNAIRKYKIEPAHLPGWNKLIVAKIDRRLNYKKQYKETKNPKFNSLQEMGKLALNGGSYGRLNTKGDWQEDPCCMLKVTMGGQLEILMIVETLLLRGFRVVSLNTDGFDAIIDRDRDEEFKAILSEFERIIGNDVLGQFEYTEFKWIAQTSVNDYIALKTDGEYKVKGDFEIDKELHKNKSMRIIPIALKEYFANGTSVEETITNHTNIYDFTIRQKSSKDFHYEGVDLKTGNRNIYNKLIRYYVSKIGEKLYKIKNPECQTNAAEVSQVNAGDWLMTVCNYLPKNHPLTNIDYSFYITKAQEIVHKVEHAGKKIKKQDKNQLSLW